MEPTKIQAILEAILFAAGEPVSLDKLARLLPEFERSQLRSALDALTVRYNGPGSGVELAEVAGGWRFRTRADLATWVGRLFDRAPLRLGKGMLEVLAIVAYRQPTTRAEIESIRGVDSGASVRKLLERDLLRTVGIKEVPGRPQLYGTTKYFLDVFGLKRIEELPPLEADAAERLQHSLPLERAGLVLPQDDRDAPAPPAQGAAKPRPDDNAN